MAKKACRQRHRSAIFIFFSIILLFLALPAFGGGSKEADLVRADELIKNRQHDEAILILTDFARRNPDKFDEAQQRLRRIYQIRDEFNRTADKLIDTLVNFPEDNERILALSRHLYTLEHENSPLLVNFVARTREIAQFNINRIRLREILERGRGLLDRGESVAAMNVYAEGLSFMREEFFLNGYGETIDNEVRLQTERITTMIAAFTQACRDMSTLSAEVVRAINTDSLTGINEAIGRLTPAMDRFIALKQELYSTANAFDQVWNRIRAGSQEVNDRNHLAFVSVVISNQGPGGRQEGMLGAFDRHWEVSVGSVVNAVSLFIQNANTASIAAFNTDQYPQSISSLNRVDSYFGLAPFFFDKHRQLFGSSRPVTVTLYGSTVLAKDVPQFLELRSLSEANNFLRQAANTGSNQDFDRTSLSRWQSGSINTEQALNSEQQTRNRIAAALQTIDNIITRAETVNTEINTHYKVVHITNTISAIQNLRSKINSENTQSAQRYYLIAQSNIKEGIAELKNQLERSRKFLNGETVTGQDGTVTTFFYPTEALQEVTAMLSVLNVDRQTINTVLEQTGNDQQANAANRELRAIANELNELHAQGTSVEETARTRSSQAEAFRQDGERLFREAQTAYQRRDYEAAKVLIDRASVRFNDSLAIQESAALRQRRDSLLDDLGRQISLAESEAILDEVRNHLNNARNFYFSGNFQQAEDSLVRARSRWNIAYTEENEEIVHWLGLVHTALAASSGRVIPPTAPLFMEMSQLLSQAQRNFEEGVRLINAGQRTQGVARFNEALALTREVKLLFPINQEAGILELRIEQFLDPRAFNASFEQRIRTAIAGTKVKEMEAFADLQNLAEINPGYPNMRNIITTAEIDMGFRPPPPDPAAVARSRELTVSANRILESNLVAQFPVALRQLDEAINLNPMNIEAPIIRDRVVRGMSVPRNVVLSAEDERDYQRALRELNAGNNLQALAIVQRLMQNPNNRNVSKVVDLQRRIQQSVL